MLSKAIQILDNMDSMDPNVITLKQLLESHLNNSKVYMLRYKGKPVTFSINTHNADFSNGSTIYLDDDGTDPVWMTTDLTTAIYAKYISTSWCNSSMETPTFKYKWKPEDIEVVDNFGNVYSRKLLKNKTMAIIRAKIFGDDGYLQYLDDTQWANEPIPSLWKQRTLLSDAKEAVIKKNANLNLNKPNSFSLDDLYSFRKKLISIKGLKLKENKPFKAIQNKLDKVNKLIREKGGK